MYTYYLPHDTLIQGQAGAQLSLSTFASLHGLGRLQKLDYRGCSVVGPSQPVAEPCSSRNCRSS